MPQRGQDRSSKGAEGEEYILIIIVSEIISSDLRISEVDISV